MVIELEGGKLADLPANPAPRVDVSASKGRIRNPVAFHSADSGRWRMSFELDPQGQADSELRAVLRAANGAALSETWLYRWSR